MTLLTLILFTLSSLSTTVIANPESSGELEGPIDVTINGYHYDEIGKEFAEIILHKNKIANPDDLKNAGRDEIVNGLLAEISYRVGVFGGGGWSVWDITKDNLYNFNGIIDSAFNYGWVPVTAIGTGLAAGVTGILIEHAVKHKRKINIFRSKEFWNGVNERLSKEGEEVKKSQRARWLKYSLQGIYIKPSEMNSRGLPAAVFPLLYKQIKALESYAKDSNGKRDPVVDGSIKELLKGFKIKRDGSVTIKGVGDSTKEKRFLEIKKNFDELLKLSFEHFEFNKEALFKIQSGVQKVGELREHEYLLKSKTDDPQSSAFLNQHRDLILTVAPIQELLQNGYQIEVEYSRDLKNQESRTKRAEHTVSFKVFDPQGRAHGSFEKTFSQPYKEESKLDAYFESDFTEHLEALETSFLDLTTTTETEGIVTESADDTEGTQIASGDCPFGKIKE